MVIQIINLLLREKPKPERKDNINKLGENKENDKANDNDIFNELINNSELNEFFFVLENQLIKNFDDIMFHFIIENDIKDKDNEGVILTTYSELCKTLGSKRVTVVDFINNCYTNSHYIRIKLPSLLIKTNFFKLLSVNISSLNILLNYKRTTTFILNGIIFTKLVVINYLAVCLKT